MTNALNFSTAEYHVIGGCDIYTTKAAGGDKKLYKNIENSLEVEYENLVRLSASLSPPYRTASEDGKAGEKGRRSSRSKRGHSVSVPEIDLSRASPFGPLSSITSRRTFAYVIATLNASHPDYDFSHALKPADFHKEKSLRSVMLNVDSTLHNLRPKVIPYSPNTYLAPPSAILSNSALLLNSSGTEVWSPKMWALINEEMDLTQCEKYSFTPEDELFDGEAGAIWSMHYFFFNKEKKRVCYFYVRGLSVISHSPVFTPGFPVKRPKRSQRQASGVSIGEGAGKRASYWLGSRQGIDTDSYGDDDDDEMIVDPADDEVEVPYMDLDEIRSSLTEGYYPHEGAEEYDEFNDGYLDEGWTAHGSVGHVRGMSEELGDLLEL